MTDFKPYEQAEEVASLRKQKAELLEALWKLRDAADDSDSFRYGTLSTRFVRDIADAAIRNAGGA